MSSNQDQPDDSSIKPVSSLRSQFETLSSSRPPHANKPPPPSIPTKPKLPHVLLSGGGSLSPAQLDASTESLTSNDTPNSAPREKKRPPSPPKPRRRPASMLPASPVKPAPPISVTSPASPPKRIEIPKRSFTPERPLTPAGLSSDAPLAHPLQHSPLPNHSRQLSLASQETRSLEALDVANVQPERSVSPFNSPPKRPKPPPPMTRNLKANLAQRESQSPASQPRKVSPFTTPPSSEDNTPPESPPPLPLHSKPRFVSTQAPLVPDLALDESRTPFKSQQEPAPPSLPPRRTARPSRSQEQLSTSAVKRSALSQGFSNKGESVPAGRQPDRPAAVTLRDVSPQRRASSDGRLTPQPPKRQQNTTPGSNHDDKALPATQPTSDLSEYPDSSSANRKPPFFPDGPRLISTGNDSRLFSLCGEYLCAAGTTTKAWNVLTGKLVLNIIHSEGVRVTALCFKPSSKVENDGTQIWLGTNWGDILEVDIPSKKVVNVNAEIHHRHEILRILRCGNNLWTLDDEGKLYVWPADTSRAPNLSEYVSNGRIGRRPTASLVVDKELWVAFGRDLRIYKPSSQEETAQPVNAHSVGIYDAGDITCATTMSSQPEYVYFGHSDGKVSIFSKKSYNCVEVVSVSIYKINSLVGVENFLWAGNSTGFVFVYDTTKRPWTIKKDWKAHEGALIGLVTDRSNLWRLDRLTVVSMGLDNVMYVWDGMLRNDWLENDMLDRNSEYARHKELDSLVVTWNTGATKPTDLRYDEEDSNFFREVLEQSGTPDVIVFGLQELVDLEDKTLTAKSFFKSKHKDSYGQEHLSSVYRAWRDYLTRCLDDAMPVDEPYILLQTASLVGLFSCVFVRAPLKSKIKDLHVAEIKTGMGGLHGNKGAIAIRFILDDSSICFVNCHLAAGQSKTVERNNDIAAILESSVLPSGRANSAETGIFAHGGDGTMIMDHEICVLSGDLNYRIDAMTRETVISTLKTNNLSKLLERDQLLVSRRKNPGFRLRAFQEMPLRFQPTYKYNIGSDQYDTSEKRRAPAWCDRILFRGKVRQLDYERHEVRVSDHRPVSASFKLAVKTVDWERRETCLGKSRARFDALRQTASNEAKLEYLQATFGLSAQEARKELGL